MSTTGTTTTTPAGGRAAVRVEDHLLVTQQPGTDDETEPEAWLEDLHRELTAGTTVHPDGWSSEAPAAAWEQRWTELMPADDDREAAPTQG